MKQGKLSNREREQWILNDEGLYNWFRSDRDPMSKFISENREEIDKIISAHRRLNKPPNRGGSL